MARQPYSLTIDLQEVTNNPLIYFNQHDYGTADLLVNILDNKVKYNLTGTQIRLSYQKSDGGNGFIDCVISDAINGVVAIDLTTHALSSPGLVESVLYIYEGSNVLVTPKFRYKVDSALFPSGEVESSNEYQALHQLIEDTKTAPDRVDEALLNIEERTDELINTKTTELDSVISQANTNATAAISQINNDGEEVISNFNTGSSNALSQFNQDSTYALSEFDLNKDEAINQLETDVNNAITSFNTEGNAVISDIQGRGNTAINTLNANANNANAAATAANNAKTAADATIANVNTAINNANLATTAANNARTSAESAANSANTAATNANNATDSANTAATQANQSKINADTATLAATNAANAANIAKENADIATANTNQAITNANNATVNANNAAADANQSKALADQAAQRADTAIINVNSATTNANNAANAANQATADANAKVSALQTSVNTTNTRLDNLVTNTGTGNSENVDGRLGADGVVRANMGTLIREIHGKQLDSAKATQTLQQGLNMINASNPSPLIPEIQGRTLVNLLGQKKLSPTGYYLFLPNKNTTKINYDGTVKEALTAFRGSDYIVQTATENFVNKIVGSVVENPHVYKRVEATNIRSLSDWTAVGEDSQVNTDKIKTLDAQTVVKASPTNGAIPQMLFSFNLIEAMQRKYGDDYFLGCATIADKVQRLKDTITLLTFNWHGYGNSPTGNKATVLRWISNTNLWGGTIISHTNGSITKLTSQTSMGAELGSDGIYHYIAYAEPSDGVTSSNLWADYAELIITTNYVKPIQYMVKQDFQRKVYNSTVDNGHIAKAKGNGSGLGAPNTFTYELTNTDVGYISTLNTTSYSSPANINGNQPQHLFSFDIIRTLTDKYGAQIWQGKTLLADKITIAKNIITKLYCNWWGYGTNPIGNKATLAYWHVGNNAWGATTTNHTNGTITKLSYNLSAITQSIDTNGFINFLVYADPSDGVTSSTLYTDYVELEITIDSNLPILEDSLYEIDQTTYNKINVDAEYTGTKLNDKFPHVQGVKHLQPYVMVEGENLLPPFSEWTWDSQAGATNLKAYEVTVNPTASNRINRSPKIKVLANQTYYFSMLNTSGSFSVEYVYFKVDGTTIKTDYMSGSRTITMPAETDTMTIGVYVAQGINSVFSNAILNVGSTAKPFTPRNPSYLYTNAQLAGIKSINDILFQDGTEWKAMRKWVKDVALEGISTNLTFSFAVSFTGFKRLDIGNASGGAVTANQSAWTLLMKYSGLPIQYVTSWDKPDVYEVNFNNNSKCIITVANLESGFAESYSPVQDEVRAYFNGWKVKTVDGSNKPTAWTSLVDGTDAPTQTLAYVKDNKASGYTPYKLTYLLATPVTEVVSVEGGLVVNEATQLEVGSGVIVREKVTPVLNGAGTDYLINSTYVTETASMLKNRLDKIVAIYRNGQRDYKWAIQTSSTARYGNARFTISKADYDSTAEYTVTYIALDKHLITSNPVDLKVTYNQSIKETIDEMLAMQTNNATRVSIHTKLLVDIIARLKAGGL